MKRALVSVLLWTSLAIGADKNVKDFGAVGEGKADDTAAFQKALDDAGKSGGGTVAIPQGSYLFTKNTPKSNSANASNAPSSPATSSPARSRL
jgi:polygalacturonase